MQQYLIQILNGAALVVILIGIPAASSIQLGNVQLLSVPAVKMVTLWGLGLAAGLNLLAALFLAQGRKAKGLCQRWMLVHGGFLIVQYLYFEGLIHFDWLKQFLLWLKKTLGGK